MKMIQKTALALAASTLLASTAFAADTPTNPEDAGVGSAIAANVTIVNDYRYRGITQTNYMPAIQGGFDYAHESGLYIGNWNSTISFIGDNQTGMTAPVEMDFYAGFKKELIAPGFASDIGVLQYYYPSKGVFTTIENPNTTEVYVAQNFTLGPVTGFAKVSYALTTLFGTPNSAGSMYPDLTVNYDTGFWGLSANAHIGYQYVAGQPSTSSYIQQPYNNISYMDYKLGMTKDFGSGLSAQVSYIGTNANQSFYVTGGSQSTWSGRGGVNFSLTKAF